MATSRFEELVAWQKARLLCAEVYEVTRSPRFVRDFGLAGQIQRAAVSVMSNIAEGFESNRDREFHQALSVAKGSCAEVRSLLYAALEVGHLEDGDFQRLRDQASEVGRVIGGLRSAVAARVERDGKRPGASTQHSALTTQHSDSL